MTRMGRQPGNLQTLVERQQWRRAAPEFHQIPCIPVVVKTTLVETLRRARGFTRDEWEPKREVADGLSIPAGSSFFFFWVVGTREREGQGGRERETHAFWRSDRQDRQTDRLHTHTSAHTHTHTQHTEVNASSLRPRVHREGLVVKAYLNDLSHGLASIAPRWTPKCHSLQVQSNTRLRQSWASSNPMLRAEDLVSERDPPQAPTSCCDRQGSHFPTAFWGQTD